ncbi:cellulose synthase-like protein E6 [Cornus florida]|uniref:cellulose synthase-like protein E6 n=1 Tax=Cornus florida TaxID=4283 RepID=UPI00289B10FD|nr:cellulose synthase-like protein E6 [Cornus florida]
MGSHGGGEEEVLPLFETKEARGRVAYRILSSTILTGICLIWVYRLTNIPTAEEAGRWAWIGMFMAELWFGLYWIVTQSVRWNVIYRFPFKDRLSKRYGDKLPGVDIFVCTADPTIEPSTMVVNTILSVMSYNYPSEKLSVYLSDDGGSQFTFYALLEASMFSKHWIPFCNKFKVEPRSPEAYFSRNSDTQDMAFEQEWLAIKKLYGDMKYRIETAIEKGCISKDIRDQHKGFKEWSSEVAKNNHQSIVQILIDGRSPSAVDNNGHQLPTLVYLAREKRPQWPHNFKAGSMNALIRVSSKISNGPVILNVDCDMYSSNSDAILESLCFFMDEERGHQISYVQYPQWYNNIAKNDIYSSVGSALNKIELAGLDGCSGAFYGGTGCFHRREGLCGRKYSKDYRAKWDNVTDTIKDVTADKLEEASKVLANCSYETGTQWGKEMGLIYGCPVEDMVTGLAIQCRGWKSVYYNPHKKSFLGLAPATLDQSLVQFKRWSEGLFQIFFSKYCPFIYGHGRIKFGAQVGLCNYLLWAPLSFPTLYYVIVPSLCLLHGIPLFPKVSSLWFLPFAYVYVARNVCSIFEAIICGDTLQAWWNTQRMLMFRRTTSFFFAFIDNILRQLGCHQTAFAITAKVIDDDVLKRYEQEILEFGSSSVMTTIIATLALLNLFSFVGGMKRIVWDMEFNGTGLEGLIPNAVLCWLIVVINSPVYKALFLRSDKGSIPSSVMLKSVTIASLACLVPVY